jgi:chromate transport protein ChrA
MIFPAWFIQVLAQCLLLFTLIFSISAVRNLANLSPWKFGLVVLALAISLRLFVPYVWDTDYLYNRVPHMQIWLIALGWCIHFAQSRSEKLTLTVILLAILLIALNWETPRSWWIIGGAMLMLWIPYVPIWKMIKSSVQTISASAYYIYLTHMIFIHITVKALKIDSPLLNVTTALLGGIATWLVLQHSLQWVFQKTRQSR